MGESTDAQSNPNNLKMVEIRLFLAFLTILYTSGVSGTSNNATVDEMVDAVESPHSSLIDEIKKYTDNQQSTINNQQSTPKEGSKNPSVFLGTTLPRCEDELKDLRLSFKLSYASKLKTIDRFDICP